MKEQIQPIQDMHTRIKDSLETVKAVKGEKFADCAYLMFLAAHTQMLVNSVLQGVENEKARMVCGLQMAGTMASLLDRVTEGLKMEDIDELTKWSDTLVGHVKTAMEAS